MVRSPYPSLSVPTESHKRLALAFVDFLNKSLKDGTLSEDHAESIEIAQSCIADSFGVDPSDEAAIEDAIGRQSLLSIYGIYEKTKSSKSPAAAATTTATTAAPENIDTPAAAAAAAAATAPKSSAATPESDKLKSQGNAALSRKDYPEAIKFYTEALEIAPGNAIYLSNRAAAYSASGDHQKAVDDAKAATESDPSYVKGWSRLGLAQFALGNPRDAMEAYQKGIEAEGGAGSDAMRRGLETAKKRVAELEATDGPASTEAAQATTADRGSPGVGMPDLSSLASMLGGGAGGAGGGMPDLSSIMSNPMFASMAQNLMSNPDMMSNLMNNPRLRDLANRFGGAGGAGGTPDLSSLMNDPSVADMARNLMGGNNNNNGGQR
ncbi:hypothetical protein KEM56_001256 [Ascosphaera pollenicola]|nr:hypothetical protein KEM56_001256 [Ascosphaera pollenicola]